MKDLAIKITLILVLIIVIYLAGAFSSASFDISTWKESKRDLCAFGMGASTILFTALFLKIGELK